MPDELKTLIRPGSPVPNVRVKFQVRTRAEDADGNLWEVAPGAVLVLSPVAARRAIAWGDAVAIEPNEEV